MSTSVVNLGCMPFLPSLRRGQLGDIDAPLPVNYGEGKTAATPRGVVESSGALPAPDGPVPRSVDAVTDAVGAINYTRGSFVVVMQEFGAAPVDKKDLFLQAARRYRFVADAWAWAQRNSPSWTQRGQLALVNHLREMIKRAEATLRHARKEAKPKTQPAPGPKIEPEPGPESKRDWGAVLTSPKVLIGAGVVVVLVGLLAFRE